jgi:outer membrane receptor protein involved in Fe transport
VRILKILSVLLLSSYFSNAQTTAKGIGKISGVVMDSTLNVPVEFANVAILDFQTRKPIDGAVCDENGKFVISKVPKGNFILSISFIGFDTKKIPITIADKKSDINLGPVQISSSARQLDAIVVQGQKDLVEEKVDRMIYNAEGDLTTKGGDATDVLKRVPLLSVDIDGNVSLQGSANVKVLINNKPSTITAASVADALKQIPSDMIKNVEVITSPSSRYDAEGSAGIINIVLKKNTLEGMFFTADGSTGNRGSNLSLNASYRKGKMGFSIGAFTRATYNVKSDFYNRQLTQSNGDTIQNVQQSANRSNGETNQFTFGWDYDIDKLNSLTASVRYGDRNQDSYQNHLLTEKFPYIGIPSSQLQNVKTVASGNNFDASLNYTRLFNKKGREFNLMTIFSQNNPINGFVTDSLSQKDQTILRSYKNDNRGQTQELTFQADFLEPIAANHSLEFGVKEISRTVTSTYTYSQAGSNGEYAPWVNPILSNGFNYNQSITSAYMSYTGVVLKNYTLKAGARYEYTAIQAHFENQPNISIPSYGVFVPSVNFSRKLKNGNLIKISYNRRIQRPTLQELNPNLQASNSLNATIGNPLLTPEYTDNLEIAYKTFYKKATINMSTFLRNNIDDIQQARIIRHDTIISIYQNIGTENNYGVSLFVTIPITEHFTINGGTDVFYRILHNNSNNPFVNASNTGFTKNFRVFGNYNFSKGWAIQFFSFFQGRNYNLQGYRTNPINHSLAIKKDILKKNGSIGVSADNFFTPAYDVHTELKSPYLVQSTTTTLYNTMIRLNLSYKIGRQLPERKRKVGNDDEN